MSTYHWLLAAWTAAAIAVGLYLLREAAPYGRHADRSQGRLLPSRYAWIVMELPTLLVFPCWYVVGRSASSMQLTDLFVGVHLVHCANRSLAYPWRIANVRNVPVRIFLGAVAFNLVNGSFFGYYFVHLAPTYAGWVQDPRFWFGLALWLVGLAINWDADNTLIALRSERQQLGYQVPETRLFSYVACPNYLGEIVEWAGYAVMTWCLPALSFFIWTAANLIPRALAHRDWYRKHFPEYPPERRALIPFLL